MLTKCWSCTKCFKRRSVFVDAKREFVLGTKPSTAFHMHYNMAYNWTWGKNNYSDNPNAVSVSHRWTRQTLFLFSIFSVTLEYSCILMAHKILCREGLYWYSQFSASVGLILPSMLLPQYQKRSQQVQWYDQIMIKCLHAFLPSSNKLVPESSISVTFYWKSQGNILFA